MDIRNVLLEANEYHKAHDDRNDRFRLWTSEKAELVKSVLVEVKDSIIENIGYFKQNLYVNDSFGFMETGGKPLHNKALRTISLDSGNTIVTYFGDDTKSEIRGISERGFSISFQPIFNGKIKVIAIGHVKGDTKPETKLLGTIEDLSTITKELTMEYVIEGIKFTKTTSFLFAE